MTSRLAINPQRLRQLLRRLVDIYSPSGKEEKILEYLHGYLKRHGLHPVHQVVDGPRHNILVLPAETPVTLAMIGHVDTVSAYDLEHYGYEEEGDLISGLGTADMKGGCAAMIEAFLAFKESGRPAPPVALVLVVGEEEEGDGAEKLVKEYHFPWALIGEPTNLKPCLSHYGYMEIEIVTKGKRVHASLANTRINPIEHMLALLMKITDHLEKQRPEIVYNIRDLSSARAGFAVPDRCAAWLDLHLPPTSQIGEISLELEEIMVQERRRVPELEGTLRFSTIQAGYELPHKWPMMEALHTVSIQNVQTWEPQAFRSHSDANRLWAAGIKPILLGPGELEMAHSAEESVSFAQVTAASQLYLDLLLLLSS